MNDYDIRAVFINRDCPVSNGSLTTRVRCATSLRRRNWSNSPSIFVESLCLICPRRTCALVRRRRKNGLFGQTTDGGTNVLMRCKDTQNENKAIKVPNRPEDIIRSCESSLRHIASSIQQRRWADTQQHQLALQAVKMLCQTNTASDLLIETYCRDLWEKAGLIPYPYQIETCRRIIDELRGRAIIADEVGLGKTIEAGMVLKEYMLRGLVQRALILAPASLTWQWDFELRDKFDIPSIKQRTEYDWQRADIVVASLDTAKRPPHRDIIHSLHYDLLIVDEAHRLKNVRSVNWRFVSEIKRKYCLLLTATPVQNDLRELYNLVTLLRPGQLGTYRQFQRRYMLDRRTPRSATDLRQTLKTCIVRNRRGPHTIEFPPRHVHALPVRLSDAERAFYDGVGDFLRGQYERMADMSSVLTLITLQRESCSSVPAALATLKSLYEKQQWALQRAELGELIRLGNDIVDKSAKCDTLLQLITDSDEQFLVFTEYRTTQRYIRWRLAQAGIASLPFDGSMSASKKEWTRHLFRNSAQVLVCTESGGEGLNFQFCRNVVNYDLPWNPMRLEQRIGRVHRLGQTRPVNIYNMATQNTVEEYILYLLHEKLNMFHAVIGDVDVLLRRLQKERTFEQIVADIVLSGDEGRETVQRLDAFARQMLEGESPAAETELLDTILQ